MSTAVHACIAEFHECLSIHCLFSSLIVSSMCRSNLSVASQGQTSEPTEQQQSRGQ